MVGKLLDKLNRLGDHWQVLSSNITIHTVFRASYERIIIWTLLYVSDWLTSLHFAVMQDQSRENILQSCMKI